MTIKTPPAAWDRHALVVARSLAGMDASRLSGKKAQFTAIIHEAIVDAMMMAREDSLDSIGNQLIEADFGEAYEIVYRALQGVKRSNTPRPAAAAVSQTNAPVEQVTADKTGSGKPEAALANGEVS